MNISLKYIGKAIYIGALLLAALLVIAGCAEIQPYSPSNHREEGPEKGLFTGSQGEWVILGPKAEETEPEEKKRPQKPADDAQ